MTRADSPEARARGAEHDADARALRRAALICAGVILAVYAVNALSITTELERAGRVRPASFPWALEGTAILAMFAALPLALWLGTRFPFERGRWRAALAVHLAGVLVFAAIQVSLMSGLRIALWPALYGGAFDFGDSALGVFVYEFRKQAASYAGFQFILATSRGLEQLRLEAAAARTEARTRHRVTLKSGGRTFHLEARDFVAAKAAGNYVEARFGTREHLARMTLAELEALLREAGVDAVRVHRSWLADRAAIAETAPTGEGDLVITLKDGTRLPGSRRYRAALEG